MTDQSPPQPPAAPLDELVANLLDCGGALSQMISHMVAFEASGKGSPDAAPIPETAHELIRSVSEDVPKRYSKRDIRIAARIVELITDAICEDIFFVPPDAMLN